MLTEHRREPFASPTKGYFCYHCDFDARVRMLVEDEILDVATASRVVHRLIAFEFPGLGVESVEVVR